MPTNTCAIGWTAADAGNAVVVGPGEAGDLTQILTYISGVATQTNPFTLRLLPGTYTVGSVLSIPSWCSVIGAGKKATVITRTISLADIAIGTENQDPVVRVDATQGVHLTHLSIIHSGTYTFGGGSHPCALATAGARDLIMEDIRAEGTWIGMNDSTATGFLKPIPDGTWGDETYQIKARNCEFVGHRNMGLYKLYRHDAIFSGCTFLADIPSGVDFSSESSVIPTGISVWEYSQVHMSACDCIVRSKSSLNTGGSALYGGGLTLQDSSVSDDAVYAEGCRFIVDIGLTGGDINATNLFLCGAVVGNQASAGAGDNARHNTFFGKGCQFIYRSGAGITSGNIGGIFLWNTGSNTDSGTVKLEACEARDLSGSGGTIRADAIIGCSFQINLREPLVFSMIGCNFQTWSYFVLAGSPTPTHSQFLRSSNNLNRQVGSSTFAAAATASGTLPLSYPSQGTAVSDYIVSLEPSASETFWVTAKTNTGFTLNSSNGASVATVQWSIFR